MYTLKNVFKFYGKNQALCNISAKIPTNKFVVILGPSGCGKSTLLRQLCFIEKPDKGNINLELNGNLFNSNDETRPWPKVTCVFQKQFLWPHLTLRKNIELPLRYNTTTNITEEIEKVTKLFDMSSFLDQFPNEVSGGQAQRVALARAFVLKPELMLIDEAHGGLDIEQQHMLNSHFVSLKEIGVGLIVVTHSLEFAQKYADFIIIMEAGKIVESGSPSIFNNPNSRFLKLALSKL